jgi:predicted porin
LIISHKNVISRQFDGIGLADGTRGVGAVCLSRRRGGSGCSGIGRGMRRSGVNTQMMMIGGYMKTTSRIALAAAASLLLGMAASSARAADIAPGGGCCADLEERVAELEATTARKGNRVVSLQVYGQVNKALLLFDDGIDSDAFVVDNDQSGSRLGFKGSAVIRPGWTAGFNMELDIQDSATNQIDQANDEGVENEIAIRQNYVFIESDRLGRISLGQQSSAADGVTEIVLGNSLSDASDIFSSFNVRRAGGANSGFLIEDFVDNLDGPREDVVRYDTPSIFGFILSASWGDDDYADVALRFKKEFNSVRVAAGVAYQWDERDAVGKEIISGSFSAMHVPSGIYVAASGGQVEFDNNGDDGNFYFGQLGIERKSLPYGSTTIYGEYGQYENIAGVVDGIEGLEAERFGFGVVQKIDSAAMEVYANYRQYSFEDGGAEDLEDFSAVLIGSRIKF